MLTHENIECLTLENAWSDSYCIHAASHYYDLSHCGSDIISYDLKMY